MILGRNIRSAYWWAVLILIGLALTLTMLPNPARAQTSFGEMLGIVTDSSGGAIPNVAVTITNTATGSTRQVKTDQSGSYRAVSLLPGPYKVSAQSAGFAVAQSDVVEVVVGATVNVNLKMQVGSTTQTVQVTAQAPLLQTEDSTVGTLVNHTDMVDLPLNGRSYTQLIQLMPGSLATGGITIGPGSSYSLNGISAEQTVYVIDGVYTNEYTDNLFSIEPSVDAIEEFNVQTNITSARYGGGGGGVVNVVTRGGTNQLHGSAWEFVRNTDFDAANFFANYANAAKPVEHVNQYGGVIAGPLFIPHLYDGREKTFWMFNMEPYKQRQNSTNYATLPTQAQLGGNFQGFNPIYDPTTTTQTGTDAQGNPIYTSTPFSCNGTLNVICPDRINPAAKAYAAALLPAVTKGGANNYLDTQSGSINLYNLTARVDQKIGSKLNFFARYSMMTASQLSPSGIPSDDSVLDDTFKNPEASLTYLINPTTVLDLKLGVLRSNETRISSPASLGAEAAAFNAQYPVQGLVQEGPLPSFYQDSWAGYKSTSSSWYPQITTVWNPTINLTKMVGRNAMEMGFSMLRNRDYNNGIYTGDFSFDNVPTSNPQNVANTGDPIASFLLELPSSGSRYAGDTSANYRWSEYAPYFQDDIKITRKLKFDVGLRYEYDEWPTNPYNHISAFDYDAGKIVWAGYNPANGEGPNTIPSIMKPNYFSFAPRVGLAYQLTPNTTVRSGYGIFHGGELMWQAQSIRGQWPYAISQFVSGTNVITPNDPVGTYFPSYTTVQPGTPPSASWAVGHNTKTTYSQQWNLDVQHEFTRNVLLDVDYIGSRSVHLPTYTAYNTVDPGPGTVGSAQHPRPYNDLGPMNTCSNTSNMAYEALQVKFQKRFSNGLQFLAFYVYGKEEDLAGASFGNSTFGAQNPNNARADWADGNYDIRHTFKASYIYQLPFGQGKRWLGRSNAITDGILGGWNVSGITTYHTGIPVNVSIPFDNANDGGTPQRPDYIPGFPARVISSSDRTQGWLNPASYVVAPQYTFGNLGRNTARGPGLGNWDFSAYKDFKIHEGRQYFQFRGESFNLFNNVNFGNPGGTFGTSSFGVISSAAAAREIQLGLKFVF